MSPTSAARVAVRGNSMGTDEGESGGTDPDLESIRNEPGYEEIANRVRQRLD